MHDGSLLHELRRHELESLHHLSALRDRAHNRLKNCEESLQFAEDLRVPCSGESLNSVEEWKSRLRHIDLQYSLVENHIRDIDHEISANRGTEQENRKATEWKTSWNTAHGNEVSKQAYGFFSFVKFPAQYHSEASDYDIPHICPSVTSTDLVEWRGCDEFVSSTDALCGYLQNVQGALESLKTTQSLRLDLGGCCPTLIWIKSTHRGSASHWARALADGKWAERRGCGLYLWETMEALVEDCARLGCHDPVRLSWSNSGCKK